MVKIASGLGHLALLCAATSASAQPAPVRTAVGTPAVPSTADTIERGVAAWERGDDATAVAAWMPAAGAEDADSQFLLAQAYRSGRGVAQDLAQAELWYRRAMAAGHRLAANELAIMLYSHGRQAEAMPQLVSAADAGEARARYLVALAQFNGDLLPRDWARAFAMMTLAAESGFAPARNALNRMAPHLSADQSQEGLAIAEALRLTVVPTMLTDEHQPEALEAVAAAPASAPKLQSVQLATASPARTSLDPSIRAATKPSPGAKLQMGAFSRPENARRLQARLETESMLAPYSVRAERQGRLTAIGVHGLPDAQTAQAMCRRLQAQGFECLATR